jgi:hypothetical protein
MALCRSRAVPAVRLFDVAKRVADVFEQLGIRYCIGGSIASGIHGEYRATNDADLVADIRPEHIAPLVRELDSEFYIDADMMRGALRALSSFNLIHLSTAYKVDVYVPKNRPFDRAQIERSQLQPIPLADGRAWQAPVASAEDTVLAKLDWYRQGGEVSDRQWRDIIYILRLRTRELDMAYLRQGAAALGVADLLERAQDAAMFSAP